MLGGPTLPQKGNHVMFNPFKWLLGSSVQPDIESMGFTGLESLERRTLLSVSLVDGVLTITGTAGDDNYVITAGAEAGQVQVQGDANDDGTYDGVTSIIINLGDGND